MQPSVHRFELAGLELNLAMNKEGQGNWERVLPEQDTETPKTAQEEPAAEDGGTLIFNISEVDIRNTRVHYRDDSTGQTVTLDEFGLRASDIKPQQAFPLDLQFHLATTEPALDIRTKLNAQLTLGEQFKRILLLSLIHI